MTKAAEVAFLELALMCAGLGEDPTAMMTNGMCNASCNKTGNSLYTGFPLMEHSSSSGSDVRWVQALLIHHCGYSWIVRSVNVIKKNKSHGSKEDKSFCGLFVGSAGCCSWTYSVVRQFQSSPGSLEGGVS